MPIQKNNTCFGAYFYSPDTQDGNKHQLSVTMSRVSSFILRAHTGTGVSHSQQRENSGEVFGKNADEWTRRVEISKEEIQGSRRSINGYIQTFSRFQRETLYRMSSGLSTDGFLISASAVPHCGRQQRGRDIFS